MKTKLSILAIALCTTAMQTMAQRLTTFDENGRVGLILDGKKITEAKYFSIEKFSEGLAVARVGNNNYGFIDSLGKEIIPLTFNGADSFYSGYAKVAQYDKKDKYKVGIINKKGEIVIPIVYDHYYGYYSEFNMFKFERNEKMVHIGLNGKEVTFLSKFDNVGPLIHNRAAVVKGEKRGYIDKNGKVVIPLKYDMVENFEDNATAKVRVGTQYMQIDTMGKLVVGNVGFNITSKVNVAKDRWVVVTKKDLKASEPVYFLTAVQYGKTPMPFGAAITWQIIDEKGNVIKEQRTAGGESCGFKVPNDGFYTVQAYYDMKSCTGCSGQSSPSAFTMEYSFNTKL